MKRLILALALISTIISGFAISMPVAAVTTEVDKVYVRVVPSTLRTSWYLDRAIGFVDTYTGSDMVYNSNPYIYSTCRAGYKCITIEALSPTSAEAKRRGLTSYTSTQSAITYGASNTFSSSGRVTIYINPDRNRYASQSTKLRIITHELGHANGLAYFDSARTQPWHYYSCGTNNSASSLMYYKVTCPNGALPHYVFTSKDRARLLAN